MNLKCFLFSKLNIEHILIYLYMLESKFLKHLQVLIPRMKIIILRSSVSYYTKKKEINKDK